MHDVRPSSGVATVVMVLCLCTTVLVGVPSTTDAQGTYVSVTNVSHTPETPTVGETFEIELTIQNQGGSSDQAVTINEVYAQTADQNKYFANDLGTLAPGGSMTVTVPATIDEPGTHSFDLKVNGLDSTGDVVSIRHPITVRVLDAERPQIEIDFERDDGVVGVESQANVTIANGLPSAIRNLRLELGGEGVDVGSATRVNSELQSTGERTHSFSLTPTEAGLRDVTAELRYTDSSGTVKTVETSERYDVEELQRQLQLDVRTMEAQSVIEVTAINLGNAPLEDIAVSADSDGAAVSTGLIDRIPSQRSRTVALNVTDITVPRPELKLRAAYDVGEDRFETSTTATAALVPGNVELTGIEITPGSGSTVQLSGTASNVGTTSVSAVTVRVQPDADVTPASSGREYFVGEIDSSDFASFTVNARLADPGNRTTIPLAVTYLVDGQQRQTTLNASYEPISRPDSSQSGGGLPIVPILVVLVIVGAGVYVWRRRRAD